MKQTQIYFFLVMFLFGCIESNKELNPNSKKELDQIVSELKAEQISYGFNYKRVDSKEEFYFKIVVYDIDKPTDFIPYTKRMIELFNKSAYKLERCDFVVFYFYKKHHLAELHKFYRIDPRTYDVLEEADK